MTPMADEEIARRAASGVTADEVREALDVDAWFAACDVTDLDPEAVDVIVKHALRDYLRDELRRALMRRPDRDSLPSDVVALVLTNLDDISAHGRAVRTLLAELRQANEP